MKTKIHCYKGVELIHSQELHNIDKPKCKSETLHMYQVLGSYIINKILKENINLIILIKE
jgi:hypothetical protein